MAEYEFSETQNVQIRDLASKMGFVGTMGALFGVLVAGGGIASMATMQGMIAFGFGNVAQGAVAFFVGVWTRAAAKSFQQIADTQGRDIANLEAAFSQMQRIYGLQRLLYGVALVLIVAALAMGIAMSVGKT